MSGKVDDDYCLSDGMVSEWPTQDRFLNDHV